MQYPMSRRRNLWAYAAVFGAMIAIFAAMHIISGADPLAYPYPSYLLQAQAWLRGEISIPNYEYLELAVFDGQYYVSFPPVPSVPMVLYTLIFGNNVPAGLFQKIYIMIAAALILSELLRAGRLNRWECAAWSVLFCLGSRSARNRRCSPRSRSPLCEPCESARRRTMQRSKQAI